MKNGELNWKQDATDEYHDTPTLKYLYGYIVNYPIIAHQMDEKVSSKKCP